MNTKSLSALAASLVLSLVQWNTAHAMEPMPIGPERPIVIDPIVRPVPFGYYVGSNGLERVGFSVGPEGAVIYFESLVSARTARVVISHELMMVNDRFHTEGIFEPECAYSGKIRCEIAFHPVPVSGIYFPGPVIDPIPLAKPAIVPFERGEIELNVLGSTYRLRKFVLDPPPVPVRPLN